MPVLQEHFTEGGNASSVLLHRADSDADPFRQVIAFHRPHDDFALEQRTKNRKAVADIKENEICRAGYEPQIHRSKFFFKIAAAFVRQLFRFTLMLFIGQRSQCADLPDTIDAKRLSRFLEHLDQFLSRNSVAESYTPQLMYFRSCTQHDNISL